MLIADFVGNESVLSSNSTNVMWQEPTGTHEPWICSQACNLLSLCLTCFLSECVTTTIFNSMTFKGNDF